MARRAVPSSPARAELSQDEKRKAIRRFEALLSRFEQFDPESIQDRRDPRVTELAAAGKSALERAYPPDTIQNRQFARLGSIEYSIPMYGGHDTPVHEVQDALRRIKADCMVLLRQALEDLKEDLEDVVEGVPPFTAKVATTRTAFIVHGHDEGPREAVARFLDKLSIKPIILHEQPNKGRTLIEKFEQHGDVPFAVVLLTPDDVGGLDAEGLRPRARQNVVLELGYFIGKLGRAKVVALKSGELEVPSDILGIAYVNYDSTGAWRQQLAREIEAAGLNVDWNAVMRS